MKKLSRSFYTRDTLIVAKELLGKILVYKYKGKILTGRIVETEGYIGPIDKAAHTYNNRKTKRTEIMFSKGGYAYVYIIYGMYYCLNVVTEKEGVGTAVLIRAIEPLKGKEYMALNRYNEDLAILNNKKKINLTNGPGKLCKAFNITKENNGMDLTSSELCICKEEIEEEYEIIKSKRININYAEEAKDFEWRFFIKGNSYVSK